MRLFNRSKKSASLSHTGTAGALVPEPTTTTFSLNRTTSSDDVGNSIQEFLDAAHRGKLDIVKEYISKGIDVNVKDDQGRTALHRAIYDGHLDMVQFFIEGCSVDTKAYDKDGRTALHYASDCGNLSIVQYLREKCHVNMEVRDNFGGTALHRASRNGHLSILRYLIEDCHLDKEAINHDGWTALHNASRYGYLNLVQYLVDTCHVHVNATSIDGRTALHYAAYYGDLDLVQYFTKQSSAETNMKDHDGNTAYDLAQQQHHRDVIDYMQRVSPRHQKRPTTASSPSNTISADVEVNVFLDAAQKGNLDMVKACIYKGIDIDTKDTDGHTALHRASSNGRLNIVQYLVEHCHVNPEAKDQDGTNALHYASKYGHLNIVQYLIETCHVDREMTDMYGSTALLLASQRDHLSLIQYLVETCHVNVEAKGNDGWRALHCASFNGFLDVVQYFTETCLVNQESKDTHGSTALHLACQRGRLNIVQYLIVHGHVDREAQDNHGWTPLHYASSNGHLDIVKCLMEEYSVDEEAQDNNGKTAHELAKKFNNSEVIDYFQEVQTERNKLQDRRIDDEKHTGITPADHEQEQLEAESLRERSKQNATFEEKKRILEFIDSAKEGRLDTLKECIDGGIDVEVKNKYGVTALHRACGSGHIHIVRYLVQECHSNVETKTNDGRTALHDACSNGHVEIVKYLVQSCHTNAEVTDNEGWTPLHFASRFGYLDIVQFLIHHCHVNVETNNRAGETAYDLTRKDEVIEYLSSFSITHDNDSTASKVEQQSSEVPLSDLAQSRGHKKEVQRSIQLQEQLLPLTTNSDPPLVTNTIDASSAHSQQSSKNFKQNEKWIFDLMQSLQIENQQIIDKLSRIDRSHQYIEERREILDFIVVEKCESLEEQEEQNAILSSLLHRDFYILLQRKLKCMIKSCEILSTGMVGASCGDLRSFTARTIREQGCNVLQETHLGFFIGNAVAWVKKNLAVVPFIDSVGSVFQLVVTLKDERDRYLGLARVSDFATMVCLQRKGATSLDSAVERFARLIVRARCGSPLCKFVEDKDELGIFKQIMVKLLADSGDTPAKEQASKAADCAFAHIMKPGRDSVLVDILYGDMFDVSLDEALAASILGMTVNDLLKLDPFTVSSHSELPSSGDATIKSMRMNTDTTIASNALLNDASASLSSSFYEVSYASSDLVAEQESKIQKQDVMIQQLTQQVARLEKASKQSNARASYDAGGGMVFANPTEQFKNEVAGIHTENVMLDRRLCDQATIIYNLMSRLEVLEKQPH